jgi:deazaflavin-dependent oxidoreductase (nitroreductase family)
MTESKQTEFWQALNDGIVKEFRANDGEIAGIPGDVLLLTTTCARSGQPRLTPLAYFAIDGRLIVVGSKAGATHNPDWVHNLRANTHAHVEVGTTRYDVVARELEPVERDETYPEVVALQPRFGDYEAKTSRLIPLFELTRA